MYHKTKDGRKIKLSDMSIDHLKNVIKMLENIAKNGLTIRDGGGSCSEEYWFEEYTLYGEEALEHLNYEKYVNELKRREYGTN